jgi:ribokinase
MTVAFNPAPMTRQIATYPLNLVDLFILNETEAHELTNETDPDKIRLAICEQYPQARTVLTMGRKGALYFDPEKSVHQPAESVKAIDTTAAGDTFIGFFLAEFMETGDEKKALQWGCRAAALCVTRSGAADSIPEKGELDLSV